MRIIYKIYIYNLNSETGLSLSLSLLKMMFCATDFYSKRWDNSGSNWAFFFNWVELFTCRTSGRSSVQYKAIKKMFLVRVLDPYTAGGECTSWWSQAHIPFGFKVQEFKSTQARARTLYAACSVMHFIGRSFVAFSCYTESSGSTGTDWCKRKMPLHAC